MKFKFFVLFCLVGLLSALSSVTVQAETPITDQTEEKQNDPPKVELVKEIIDDHRNAIKNESKETGVPEPVIVAVIASESSNDPSAKSSVGAKGLMQTMPGADKTTGIRCNSMKPKCSIKKGTRYIKHLVEDEGIQKWARVFLAYNEGPAGSKRYKSSEKVLAHSYVKKCTEYLHIAQAVLAAQEI